MNTQEAAKYIKSSTTVSHENYSWNFTQETIYQTSVDMFVQAVEALDGWIYQETCNRLSTDGKPIYKTIACIPELA